MANAARFVNEVDSAAVYVNASTRFYRRRAVWAWRYGGQHAEIKHACGPMGLEALPPMRDRLLAMVRFVRVITAAAVKIAG